MRIGKRYIFAGLGFLLAFILQTTILKNIAIFGWSPNLLLCLVVVCSILYDDRTGLIYGIIFGLLLDYMTGLYLGPSAIAFTLIYMIAILIRQFFNHERLLPELILAGVSTPVYLCIAWAFHIISGNPASFMIVLKALSVLLIYNTVLIILLHLVLVRGVVSHRRDMNNKGKFRVRGGIRI